MVLSLGIHQKWGEGWDSLKTAAITIDRFMFM